MVKEIDSVLNGSPEVTQEHIGHLTYMSQVLKETLRLYPIVAGATRQIIQDTVVDGLLLPKGAVVMVCDNIFCIKLHQNEGHCGECQTKL